MPLRAEGHVLHPPEQVGSSPCCRSGWEFSGINSIPLLSLQNFLQFVHFNIHLLHGVIKLLIIHHGRLKKRHHDG